MSPLFEKLINDKLVAAEERITKRVTERLKGSAGKDKDGKELTGEALDAARVKTATEETEEELRTIIDDLQRDPFWSKRNFRKIGWHVGVNLLTLAGVVGVAYGTSKVMGGQQASSDPFAPGGFKATEKKSHIRAAV